MGFQSYKYELSVVDQRSLGSGASDGVISSGCLVRVFDAGTKTHSTVYSNANLSTAKTVPISRSQFATDGKIVFWSTASSHDLAVYHSDGSWGVFSGVTPVQHTLVINRDAADKMLVAQFGASDNTEVDTELDFPYASQITDAFIEVTTTDASETISVGLLSSESGGDADGLLAAVSVANSGYPARVVYTTGSNETYVSSNLYGALIASGSVGNDVATDVGSVFLKGYIVNGSGAKSLTYTGSASSDTAAGFIYVPFRVLS